MSDAASRSDLLKALNNFMAALYANDPLMVREEYVTLEVGDVAFRAFERALDDRHMSGRRLVPEKPSGTFTIEWHTEAGRVVIRKREAQPRRCCAWDTDGDGECPKHPMSGPFAKAMAERAAREAQLEREKADRPVHVTDLPKDDFMPVKDMMVALSALSPCARERVEDRGGALFIRHDDLYGAPKTVDAAMQAAPANFQPPARRCPHDFGAPTATPEESKPTDRPHLKGCTMDTTHDGPCMPSKPTDAQMKERGEWLESRDAPSLSPRQALGEALACVERARDLLQMVVTSDLGRISPEAHFASLHAYNSTRNAWDGVTSARTLIGEAAK